MCVCWHLIHLDERRDDGKHICVEITHHSRHDCVCACVYAHRIKSSTRYICGASHTYHQSGSFRSPVFADDLVEIRLRVMQLSGKATRLRVRSEIYKILEHSSPHRLHPDTPSSSSSTSTDDDNSDDDSAKILVMDGEASALLNSSSIFDESPAHAPSSSSPSTGVS